MIKNVHLLSKSLPVAVFLLLCPLPAAAAVFISEVAWMGSLESANHEWIELTNNGPAIAVDGWTLTDTQNLSIELAGTIPANTAVVLERSSDNSAPGAAFLIYTGALVNTGTDLSVYDASGQLVERVVGGENWQSIGGDNTTKATAQYSSQGWYTAAATPGVFTNTYQAPEAEESEPEPEEDSAKTSPASTRSKISSGSTQTVPLTLPDITLQLQIDAQEIGYVNQSIAFSAEPSGVGQHLEDSLQYQWNFGDGFTSSGKSPEHIFAYPGKYVVTLKAEYKRQQQVTRHEITILPVKVSLTQNTKGDVQVHNDTQYELDISGYTVAGAKQFVFPEYSLVLPQQTVTIPRRHLKDQFDPLVAVYDTQGVLLASSIPRPLAVSTQFAQSSLTPAKPAVVTQSTPAPAASVVVSPRRAAVTPEEVDPQESFTSASSSPLVMASPEAVIEEPAEENTPPSELPRNERLVYVAFATLILLGVLGVYLSTRRTRVLDVSQ